MLTLPPAIVATGAGTIGELNLERLVDGSWRIRTGLAPSSEVESDPDAVRGAVRFDDLGRYRPLSGLNGTPSTFATTATSESVAAEVVEAVYPLALAHLEAFERGILPVVGIAEMLARQSGRYEGSGSLSAKGREAARDALCGRCIRVPVWDGRVPAGGQVPCPEPCSVLVALCREAAIWEQDLPNSSPIDALAPIADFEAEGNEIREEVIRRLRTLD